jgi:hypothetical protein
MNELVDITRLKIVTCKWRRNMDGLEVDGAFKFPSQYRNVVNNVMGVSFHMMPYAINKKRFGISKIERCADYLMLTRLEDFKESEK